MTLRGNQLRQRALGAAKELAKQRGERLTDVFADTLAGDLARLQVMRRLRAQGFSREACDFALQEVLTP